MVDSLLVDVGIIIIAATLISIVVRLLKQPLVLGYILGGIVVGPQILNYVKNSQAIFVLSELGIAFLLFIIGMELDLKRFAKTGTVSTLMGIFQVIVTASIGFLASYFLGFSLMESFYLGVAVAFSSTMIVIKLLVDKKELESIHGELILGIMLIQDIIAILVLSIIPFLDNFNIEKIGGTIVNGILLLFVMFLIYQFVLSTFLKAIVKSPELLFIGSLSIIIIYSGIASFFGYSLAIGAFIGGISLSATEFRYDIQNRIKPFRDFFLVLFFVTLGMQIIFENILKMIYPFIVLLLIVIVVKPVTTFILAKFFQYGNRTAFFTGVEIGQVGEFSLVLASIGASDAYHHISSDLFSMITILTLITMVITAYVINYDNLIYCFFSRLLKPIESKTTKEEKLKYLPKKELKNHVIVFGYHKIAAPFIKTLIKLKDNFIVVDYNAEKVMQLMKKNIPCICSDLTNPDLLADINFCKAKMLVSTIKNFQGNLDLIRRYKSVNKKGIMIVVAASNEDAIELYKEGADYVILPEALGGEKISNYMVHLTPPGIRSWGKKHMKSIAQENEFL